MEALATILCHKLLQLLCVKSSCNLVHPACQNCRLGDSPLPCHIHSPRGGILKLFFDGVCGPRSETPTHIQGFFSFKKWLIWLFFRNFANQDPFLQVFLPHKWLIFNFFTIFVKWDTLLKILLNKTEPLSTDFWWKSHPFGRHIPACFNMWVPPGPCPSIPYTHYGLTVFTGQGTLKSHLFDSRKITTLWLADRCRLT